MSPTDSLIYVLLWGGGEKNGNVPEWICIGFCGRYVGAIRSAGVLHSAERTVAFSACILFLFFCVLYFCSQMGARSGALLSPCPRLFNSIVRTAVGPDKEGEKKRTALRNKTLAENTTEKTAENSLDVNMWIWRWGPRRISPAVNRMGGFFVACLARRVKGIRPAPRLRVFYTLVAQTPDNARPHTIPECKLECVREALSRLAKCFTLCTSPPSIITQRFVDTNAPQSVTETALYRPL